jgi:hypothetical protein
MASDSRRRAGLALIALPVLAMMGLFAWAGSLSTAGSPTAIAQAFVADYNAGDCHAALGLVGASPLYSSPPSCAGFRPAAPLTSCTYGTGVPPAGDSARVAATYRNLAAVDVRCSMTQHGLHEPVGFDVVTAVRSSNGETLIIAIIGVG